MSDRLQTTSEIADLLQVAQITLRKWRLGGSGPRFVRVGANVRYRQSDIDAWLAARTASSTSEPFCSASNVEDSRRE